MLFKDKGTKYHQMCYRSDSVPICVNARFLTQRVTGVQRYAIEISRRLKQRQPNVRFLTPKGIIQQELADELEAETVSGLTGHAWEQFALPYYTRDSLLINLCNSAPLCHPNQIVVIHDAAVFAIPKAYSRSFAAWYRFLFHTLARGGTKLLTVSRFSQKELTRRLKIPEHAIDIVSPSASHVLRFAKEDNVLDRLGLRDRSYILAVGSLSPHKNFDRLVRAFSSLVNVDFEIVIAGGVNRKVHGDNGHGSNRSAIINYAGFVSDEQLAALYANASAFVHPAYYEGFGIPPLEAMTLGCPVICSSAASLPEVCGEAAWYFNPLSVDSIKNALIAVMLNPRLREEMELRGIDQARSFSWDRSMNNLLRHADVLRTRRGGRKNAI